MTPWLEALKQHLDRGQPCVLVTITGVRGSTPRKAGAHMLVGPDGAFDSIGGGRLEHVAIEHANELLHDEAHGPVISSRQYNLAAELSQCCGGCITLQFERHPAPDFVIDVFGAGHVAQETARILCRVPCVATFHDHRVSWLSGVQSVAEASAGVGVIRTRVLEEDVYSMIEAQSAGRYYVVMTHSHDRDFECVEAILSRGDSLYCGLIASASKAQRFRTRLKRKQFEDSDIDRLTAPLGRNVKTGHTPMEVAVAAVSDLLTTRAMTARESTRPESAELISLP